MQQGQVASAGVYAGEKFKTVGFCSNAPAGPTSRNAGGGPAIPSNAFSTFAPRVVAILAVA